MSVTNGGLYRIFFISIPVFLGFLTLSKKKVSRNSEIDAQTSDTASMPGEIDFNRSFEDAFEFTGPPSGNLKSKALSQHNFTAYKLPKI